VGIKTFEMDLELICDLPPITFWGQDNSLTPNVHPGGRYIFFRNIFSKGYKIKGTSYIPHDLFISSLLSLASRKISAMYGTTVAYIPKSFLTSIKALCHSA
jgi:hypothetical protein